MADLPHGHVRSAMCSRAPAAGVAPAQVAVSGFKHAAVQLMCAAVLANQRLRLMNCPDVEDVRVIAEILHRAGADVEHRDGVLRLDPSGLGEVELDPELAGAVHGALYLLPALVVRQGRAVVPQTGGCSLDGTAVGRPVAHMVEVLRTFGARVDVDNARLTATADGLRGAVLDIRDFSDEVDVVSGPRVSGATKCALLCALGAMGQSIIRHAYRKPDVTELVLMANRAGADVRWEGGDLWVRRSLHDEASPTEDRPKEVVHELVPCCSELMTCVAYGVLAGQSLVIHCNSPGRLVEGFPEEVELMRRIGVPLSYGDRTIELSVGPELTLRPMTIDVTSRDIYSDNQPFFALMATHGEAGAISTIRERVWAGRFTYADELRKIGAVMARSAEGRNELTITRSEWKGGGDLHAADLRSAATLLVAACAQSQPSRVSGLEHLPRGYPDLCASLRRCGALIEET
ncbi:MAG: hypothetical protein WAQ05_07685 [Rubrivivax sp.]